MTTKTLFDSIEIFSTLCYFVCSALFFLRLFLPDESYSAKRYMLLKLCWVIFAFGNIGWMTFAEWHGFWFLFAQHAVLTAASIVWLWLVVVSPIFERSKQTPHDIKVGDILMADLLWFSDSRHYIYFQVTALLKKRRIEIRELKQERKYERSLPEGIDVFNPKTFEDLALAPCQPTPVHTSSIHLKNAFDSDPMIGNVMGERFEQNIVEIPSRQLYAQKKRASLSVDGIDFYQVDRVE